MSHCMFRPIWLSRCVKTLCLLGKLLSTFALTWSYSCSQSPHTLMYLQYMSASCNWCFCNKVGVISAYVLICLWWATAPILLACHCAYPLSWIDSCFHCVAIWCRFSTIGLQTSIYVSHVSYIYIMVFFYWIHMMFSFFLYFHNFHYACYAPIYACPVCNIWFE